MVAADGLIADQSTIETEWQENCQALVRILLKDYSSSATKWDTSGQWTNFLRKPILQKLLADNWAMLLDHVKALLQLDNVTLITINDTLPVDMPGMCMPKEGSSATAYFRAHYIRQVRELSVVLLDKPAEVMDAAD